MLATLFDESANVYHAQYADFLRQINHGHIGNIVLAGHMDKGFYVVGRINSPSGEVQCVLVNQHLDIRFIKCPDNAHTLLYKMGVNEFEIDATSWDMEKAFNPHRVSRESRQRKKRREEALRYRLVYLSRYGYVFNHIQVGERIRMLVECAVAQGWLEAGSEVSTERFSMWFDNHELVPGWAMKSAALLATHQGDYPRDDLEMSAFACIWFSMHAPFSDVADVKRTLPVDFVSTVVAAGVSPSWIETVFNDEIFHARQLERKEQSLLESGGTTKSES